MNRILMLTSLILCGLIPSSSTAFDPLFDVRLDYGVGLNPYSVTSADFDGDGKPDLAVANWGSASVSILKNNGNGTFAGAVNYGVGDRPFSVTSADFDGDGKADLAVANYNSASVSILKNNGNGTFAGAVNYGVGIYPYSVTSADFDGDGKPDLAVTNLTSYTVSILKNNGNGTFAGAVNYGVGIYPYSVTSADFDGDGRADLAVANDGSNSVSILKNNGNGTFAAAVNYGVGSNPRSVTSADFDGDGKADLAVANVSSISVSILKNNGNGTFAAAVNYGVGSSDPLSVTSADFDGDGKPDLAVANGNANTVSILKNNGNGTFASAVNYGVGSYSYSVTSADFDGDGRADLAVTNVLSISVSILKNNGNGTFAVVVNYGVGSSPASVTSADFDGDGKADLAVTNFSSISVSILKNNGNGTFAAAVNYGMGNNPYSVTSADFDGDGKADLAVTNYYSASVSILKNNGNGTFAAAVNYGVGDSPSSVTSADFDGDGKADLAVTGVTINSSSVVSILKNNGNGTFAAVVNYGVGVGPVSVTSADFDGDGKADLAVANTNSNNVSILKNNGNGTFAVAANYGVGSYPSSVISADFDGDGKADLAVANNSFNSVSILKNNGNGTFAAAVNYGVGSNPRSVTSADFDGDGKADLAVANVSSNSVSILINKGGAGPTPFVPVFSDYFTSSPNQLWVPTSGSCSWQSGSGIWLTSATGQQVYCIRSVGDSTWRNYDYQVDVKGNAGVDKVVNFRLQDANHWYGLNLRAGSGPGGAGEILLTKRTDAGLPDLLASAPAANTNGNWYTLKVQCVDETFHVFVNGVERITYTDTADIYYSGGIGLTCYTGAFGSCDVSFDNVLVTDPYPHIEFNEVVQGEFVGDQVTISGTLTHLSGLPYAPTSGVLIVEDPAQDIITSTPVAANGSFSYSAPTAGTVEGVHMYVFACSTLVGEIKEMYNLPLYANQSARAAITFKDVLLPLKRNYEIKTGNVKRSFETATSTLSRRANNTRIKVQNSAVTKALNSVYGSVKNSLATAHRSAFPSGNFFSEVNTIIMTDCNTPNLIKCAKAQGQLALRTIDLPWSSAVQVIDDGVDKLFEKGLIDNCTYQGAKAGIAVGDLIVTFVGLSHGSFQSVAEGLYANGEIEGVGTVLGNNFYNCLNPNKKYPSMAATLKVDGYDGVLMSVEPKRPMALTVTTHSPVDIKVIDPLGREVSKDVIEVEGAEFIELDMDMDDDLEQLIIVPMDSTLGDCQVIITAQEGANPNDTFSVIADYTYYQEPLVLADNLPISEVPTSPLSSQTFVNRAPGNFGLVTADNVLLTGFPCALNWSAAVDSNPGHIVSYSVVIAKQADFSDSAVFPVGTDTSFFFYGVLTQAKMALDTASYFWKVLAYDDWGATTASPVRSFSVEYCCIGTSGNVDCDVADVADISDLTALIDYLFISLTPLCCEAEANIDGDAPVDISDLTALIDHLFISLAPTAPCQ